MLHQNTSVLGHVGGSVGQAPPLAQVTIPGSRDRAPCPVGLPAQRGARPSLSLCLLFPLLVFSPSLWQINKILKKKKKKSMYLQEAPHRE